MLPLNSNHSLFPYLFQPNTQREVFDIPIMDFIRSNKVSVRLLHCIKAADADSLLPFKTIGEYIQGGNEAFERLKKLPNLGQKTAIELNDLILQVVNNPQSLKNIINANLSDLKTPIAINAEINNISLLKLVETFGVSVRLENCIKQAHIDNDLPYQTIGEYLQGGIQAFEKLKKIPNLGKKTALELNELILNIVANSPLVETKIKLALYDFDTSNTNSVLNNHSVNGSKAITIEILLGNLKERQKEVIELRYGLNFNPTLTLEQIGSIYHITRERVRQIEAKSINLLRKQFADWAKKELSPKTQEIWSIITHQSLILPSDANSLSKKLLSPEVNFLIDIAFINNEQWLDSISKLTSIGRISISENEDRIKNVFLQLDSNLKTIPLPIHCSVLEEKIDISKQDLSTALQLIKGINFYASYLSNRVIGKRLKRAFRVHALLISKKNQGTITIGELKDTYIKLFNDDNCSTRDLLIVMTASPHLFLNCYEHGWAGLGKAEDLNVLTNLDEGEIVYDDLEKDELAEGGFEGASQILKDILTKYGPLKFDVIRQHFIAFSQGRYSKSSVGPLLILRDDFVRLAPGVYCLKNHLSDESAVKLAENLLLDSRQAELYCHAKIAGEPFHSFPLWTPKMEFLWTQWAKDRKETNLLQSLLKIAEPLVWPVKEDEKNVWLNLKEKQGSYHFLEKNPIDLTKTLPNIRNFVAAAVIAKKNGYLNWMSVNRTMGLRVDDRHAQTTLALLVGMNILKPASHWQLKHLYNESSSYLIEGFLSKLSLTNSIENLISQNSTITSENFGWIDKCELNNLIKVWIESLDGQSKAEMSETSHIDSLEDLLKYVQLKKTEESIYG